MADITFTIRYIALVAADSGNTGARIAFPHQKHVLKISGSKTITAGRRMAFEIFRGSQSINEGKPQGLPLRGRVVSMQKLTGESIDMMATDDLHASGGPAQAVLHVHGGAFRGGRPHTKSRHKDSEWWADGKKIGPLTDTIVWSIPHDGTCTYFLNVDGKRTELGGGDHLTFENKDTQSNEFEGVDDGMGGKRVEMSDVSLLYGLLAKPPANTPTPVAAFIPESTEGLLGLLQKLKLLKNTSGGDLPLCPVAETP